MRVLCVCVGGGGGEGGHEVIVTGALRIGVNIRLCIGYFSSFRTCITLILYLITVLQRVET